MAHVTPGEPSTATLGSRIGTVEDYDDHRGLGSVVDADGTSFPFHCTAIADGTRTIESGTAVHFVVAAGRGGRWEASRIVPR